MNQPRLVRRSQITLDGVVQPGRPFVQRVMHDIRDAELNQWIFSDANTCNQQMQGEIPFTG